MSRDQLNATFAALADPTRRAILRRLTNGEASVTQLAKPFAMSQPAISKHLKVLEQAGLISRHRSAQRRWYRLRANGNLAADGAAGTTTPPQSERIALAAWSAADQRWIR